MAENSTQKDYLKRNLEAVMDSHNAEMNEKLDKIQDDIDTLSEHDGMIVENDEEDPRHLIIWTSKKAYDDAKAKEQTDTDENAEQ